MKSFSIIITVFLLSGFAFAEDDITSAPYFFNLGSLGSNSTLTMQCDGEPPFQEISCSFAQAMIHASTPEQKESNLNDALKELGALKSNEIESLKKSLTIDKSSIKKITDKSSKEQNTYINELVRLAKNIEAAKDKSALRTALIDFYNFNDSSCNITANTFNYNFTRVNKYKWIYNPTPQGLCNVVRVATIENSKESPNLWTFSQITASADTSDYCKKWVEVGDSIVYSWNAPKALSFEQCKYLQFGY